MKAVSLLIVLALSRVLGTAGHQVTATWWSPIAYFWHDAVVVLVFAAGELALRRHTRIVSGVYAVAASYIVLNIPIQRALSSPLTVPMWRAAGGPLADSIRHYATSTNALVVAIGIGVVLTAPVVCRRVPVRPVLIALLACAALGPIAAARVDTLGMERNAWSALAGGTAVVTSEGALAERDWREGHVGDPRDENLLNWRGAAAGRNVVLVSLESTAARYLGLYGAAPDVAPNLSELSQSAVVFDNAYAVYPESIKGLFSILCSRAPAFDTRAESYRAVKCDSLAAVLAARGYRTALFHSGRFEYLGMNAIVQNRDYGVLADAGDIGGQHDSSFGIDEPSTVSSILRWIDSAPGQPFFVTYLPIAGHHPYETPERGPFADASEFGRYRNALHYGDAALGALRQGLQARGLDRNTMWVVLGDHGEAFGQHEGNYGHTFQLYDENVHVPFVMAAPGLMPHATRARRVVSLLDTAPTVLDTLGLPIPRTYQGSSMLDGRCRMALFFTDYSLPLVGLRDGPRKFIHDLRSGRSRWFDLETDPDEKVDLSARYPDEARGYAETLEGWITYERSAFDKATH